MPSYAQLQTEKVNLMLELLLQSPESFREHFKWYDIPFIPLSTYDDHPFLPIG